jgi:hypothetical protein
MRATLEALGDDMPSYMLQGENRGAGMIATCTRGPGEVFNSGSTEWPYALSTGDPFVTQVARNVLDRYLAKL